jgi:DNA repair exonuclease SbcCD ATPase subunit
MSANDFTDSSDRPKSTHSHTGILWLLAVGMALALAGNVFQLVKNDSMTRDMARIEGVMQGQIAKLSDSTSAGFDVDQQRLTELRNQLQGATDATLRQARSEVKRSSSQLSQALEQRHQDVVNQLSDLKQDTSAKLEDASSKLQDTSTKLTDTSVKLDQVSSDVEKTGSDLKRVVGDMGVMSGDIATNGKELATLKQLGERDYFEFDLSKAKTPQKVGDIRLELKKADPKQSRFTVAVYADDKIVEKKDRTINEPVQLYVSGSRQPYEIVINQVKKNEIVGYLATPKVKTPRGQGASSGF